MHTQVSQFTPVEKELVFDVDMTGHTIITQLVLTTSCSVSTSLLIHRALVMLCCADYDDVRRCCSSAQICERCWPLMAAAQKVVDHILKSTNFHQHTISAQAPLNTCHGEACSLYELIGDSSVSADCVCVCISLFS